MRDLFWMWVTFGSHAIDALRLLRAGVPRSVVVEGFQLSNYWGLNVQDCVRVVMRARKEDLPAMDLVALMEAENCDFETAIAKLRAMHATKIPD